LFCASWEHVVTARKGGRKGGGGAVQKGSVIWFAKELSRRQVRAVLVRRGELSIRWLWGRLEKKGGISLKNKAPYQRREGGGKKGNLLPKRERKEFNGQKKKRDFSSSCNPSSEQGGEREKKSGA